MGYRIDVDYRRAAEEKDAFFRDLFEDLERRRRRCCICCGGALDLFIGVFTGATVCTLLWDEFENPQGRYHESFLRFYRRLDEIIGEILATVADELD